jgi:MFS family permease
MDGSPLRSLAAAVVRRPASAIRPEAFGARRDLFCVYGARAARGFADGFAVIVLPAYLVEIGFNSFKIGVVSSAALLGAALSTLAVGLLAARHDLRKLLLLGALLMIATGIAIPNVAYLVLMIPVVFIGTMNPQAGDIGMMVPLEQAVLARGASDEERTRIYSRYSLSGDLATAAGSLAAMLPDAATAVGIEKLTALKALLYLYAALGLVSLWLYRALPASRPQSAENKAPLGPSRRVVYQLTALFTLDAFAAGFAVQSLVALWLFRQFGMSLTTASIFFFCTSILNALSYPVAAWLARRIGLMNTMVYTHIPSHLFLIAAAIAPSLPVALTFLLARAAVAQMDVPTRTSYVMAVVTPAEQPAAASITAVPRTLALSVSPAITGALLSTSLAGLPFIICGTLKTIYDLSLMYVFRGVKPPEEQERDGGSRAPSHTKNGNG